MVIDKKNPVYIEELKRKLVPIMRKHQVVRASIFGSVAIGTAKKHSDLDLLVEFSGEKSLLDLVSLKLDLEDEVNRKVDVLTYNSVHPLILESVKRQEVRIF
jgi:uncharacterized protein